MDLDAKPVVEIFDGQIRGTHEHINSIQANLKSLHLEIIARNRMLN